MKKLVCFTAATLMFFGGFAQDEYDPDAKVVLDELSSKTSKYTSIKSTFTMNMKNSAQGIDVSEEGSVIVKGSKYVFELGDLKMMHDGREGWSYDAEMNEAYSICDDEEGDGIFSDPSKVFTMYEDGFKYSYGGLTGDTHKVKLYPEDAGDVDYHTVELHISDSKTQITKIVVHGKDGNVYTYSIKSFETNGEFGDSTFKFDEDDYPGVDMYDDC